MYADAKMIPVEMVPEIKGWETGHRSGGWEVKYDIFDAL
jgi:hypothetical protein